MRIASKLLRKLLKLAGLSMLLLLSIGMFAFGVNYYMTTCFESNIYHNKTDIPKNEVALVLGTNPLIYNRYINPYFSTRIEAAVELYCSGKVNHILVSGDNGHASYDEPTAMQQALIKKGVLESDITLDYAGFSTLDSVIRSKKVFQQSQLTIISQGFHNYRACFLAKQNGIDAIAYNAKTPFPNIISKPEYREYLARCKAIIDTYILNKQPKFLGEKISIKTT